MRKEKLEKRRKLKIKRGNCFMLLKNTLVFVLVSWPIFQSTFKIALHLKKNDVF
jgi:hypothetical protein